MPKVKKNNKFKNQICLKKNKQWDTEFTYYLHKYFSIVKHANSYLIFFYKQQTNLI